MLGNKKFFVVALVLCFLTLGSALNAQTDSPYSRYGLGTLKSQSTGPSRGMGGVGYGLYTSQSANPLNPASYARVDSLTFIFDVGINYNYATFKEGANKSYKSNGGLDYITLLFPVSKKIGVSLGLLPYSSNGYNIGITRDIGEDSKYLLYHKGSGGLSLFYLGMGYMTPIKGLSVGFNTAYLFGNLKYDNTIPAVSETADLPTQYSRINITTIKVDLGMQYQMELENRSSLTIGATYTPKINGTGKLKKERYTTGQTSSEVLMDKSINTGTPHIAGLGFIYNRTQNILIGADVTYEHWKGARFTNEIGDDYELTSNSRFNNRWKFAVGGEYRIAEFSNKFIEKIKVRGGINYSNSYINISPKKTPQAGYKGYNEYGGTLGFGIPISDKEDLGGRTSYININFEYKYLKPELSSMLSENYFGVSLNVNINELWFFKRKIN